MLMAQPIALSVATRQWPGQVPDSRLREDAGSACYTGRVDLPALWPYTRKFCNAFFATVVYTKELPRYPAKKYDLRGPFGDT